MAFSQPHFLHWELATILYEVTHRANPNIRIVSSHKLPNLRETMKFPLLTTLAVLAHRPARILAFAPSQNGPSPSSHSFSSSSPPPSSSSSALRMSALETLADMTTLSIDSGDIDTVSRYARTGLITDATTNPLFVSQAGSNGDARYEAMVAEAVSYAKGRTCPGDGCPVPADTLNVAMDRLAVNLGRELVRLVPGRVSTEVDIRLSYDAGASVERARSIIDMYRECGVPRERILIKLAGTWEGIQAAKILEAEGIRCNITLVFSFLQAAAAAQAGAYLISPFPGRILDWHRKRAGVGDGGGGYFAPDADPGVLAVRRMYAYFRRYGYATICMPASWRPSRGPHVPGSDVDEVLALAGIDEMTIPPGLLDSLSALESGAVSRRCDAVADAATCTDPDFRLTGESYASYWAADACGREKLAEGIDAFTAETEKLLKILIEKF
jgi:transaldolase